MGLTLAVGLVVDDAIVMLENIFRHMEEDGLSAYDAALKGSREIGFTIISISISLVAVFIPVLADGRRGRPHLQRVRGGGDGRDPGLDVRLADTDANAVFAALVGASSWAAAGRRVAQDLRKWRFPARLRSCAGVLPQPPAAGRAGLPCQLGAVSVAAAELAEGVLSAGRYQPALRFDRSARGHFFRCDDEAAGCRWRTCLPALPMWRMSRRRSAAAVAVVPMRSMPGACSSN